MTKHERTRIVLLEIACAFLLLSLMGLAAYTYYILNTVAPVEAHRQCIDFIDEVITPQAEAECDAVLNFAKEECAVSSTPSQVKKAE